MAMKKKFLGLALAAAVALPATGVYAYDANPSTDGKKQLLEMDKDETGEVTIPINGIVKNKQGQVSGRIEVELPSKMAFVVQPNGTLPSTKYTIKNNSSDVNIQLAVSSFKGGKAITDGSTGGIQLLSKTKFSETEVTNRYRNQVSLELSKIGEGEIDLGDFANVAPDDRKLGTIDAQGTADIWLRGTAGTKDSAKSNENSFSDDQKTDVDSKGAQENFELVFSISKAN